MWNGVGEFVGWVGVVLSDRVLYRVNGIVID